MEVELERLVVRELWRREGARGEVLISIGFETRHDRIEAVKCRLLCSLTGGPIRRFQQPFV